MYTFSDSWQCQPSWRQCISWLPWTLRLMLTRKMSWKELWWYMSLTALISCSRFLHKPGFNHTFMSFQCVVPDYGAGMATGRPLPSQACHSPVYGPFPDCDDCSDWQSGLGLLWLALLQLVCPGLQLSEGQEAIIWRTTQYSWPIPSTDFASDCIYVTHLTCSLLQGKPWALWMYLKFRLKT